MRRYPWNATGSAVLLSVIGLAACASERRAPPLENGAGGNLPSPGLSVAGTSDDDELDSVDDAIDGIDMLAIDAHLEGRLGTIDVDATPYRMDSSVSRDHVHIALYAEGTGGEGMIAVDMRGGLAHPDFGYGVPVTFDGLEPSDPAALFVNAIACSGLRAPMWDYDAPASEITIRVRPVAADRVEVEIDAQFGAGFADASHAHAFVTLGR